MSQLQHSPGPWTFHRNGWYIEDLEGNAIAEVNSAFPGDGQIFAAAPDMLRLLRVLCWPYDIPWDKLADQVMEARELITRLDGAE